MQAEQHKDLPRNAQWSAERDAEFHDCRQTGLKNLMLNKFLGVFRKFDSLDQVTAALMSLFYQSIKGFKVATDPEYEMPRSSRALLVWVEGGP